MKSFKRKRESMCGVKLYFFFFLAGFLPSVFRRAGGGRAAVEKGTRQKTQP